MWAITQRIFRLTYWNLLIAGLLGAGDTAVATVHYADANSPTPTPPYTTWATAARLIQAAVDMAESGDTVLVNRGVYAAGGRAVVGTMTNRVAIDKAIRVESLMGPGATFIVGAPSPGGTNGDGAVRCVYLGVNATLSGFTLTNGYTRSEDYRYPLETVRGGGAFCQVSAVLTNCVITGNSASDDGAGVYGGVLYRCTLADNHGGENNADGGGADHATLYQCTLTGNSGRKGGAADNCTLYSCILTRNKARVRGGGASRSVLYNCTVRDNSSRWAGGAHNCTVYNSIVYGNRALFDDNSYGASFSYSCTTPLPSSGVGNIDLDPQMASWSHLSSSSPCNGAGSSQYATGADIDGETWATPPCIGADQLVPGSATGPLLVAIRSEFTNLTVGFVAPFRAQIEGQTCANRWTFGDGTVLSNQLECVHAWQVPGLYEVSLSAFNDAQPAGVSMVLRVRVVEAAPIAYVNRANLSPAIPYTSWATAATNIQDAIDSSSVAGRLVLVTNGVYDIGGVAVWGLMTNRIALASGVVVRSVNGPEVTIMSGSPAPSGENGDGAIRCAYVGDLSVLEGFTLTNGHTRSTGHLSREQGGGGVWCERTGLVKKCIFLRNQAARDGGGANGGLFQGCAFLDNQAGDEGGGADDAVLYQCTLTGNLAIEGGGVSESEVYNSTLTGNVATFRGGGVSESAVCNSIIYYNTALDTDPNHGYTSDLSYCCTTASQAPWWYTFGPGNIFAPPLLSNLRLESNSPCINAGANRYTSGETDRDGNLRIVGGTVDIGAYEFQSPKSVISYAWLQQYGLPTDGSADSTDADADGHNNWQEWRCQTVPTNALSALRLLSATPASNSVVLTWQSVPGVSYFLERSPELPTRPSFATVATNIAAQGATTIYTNTNTASEPGLFYRVGVRN